MRPKFGEFVAERIGPHWAVAKRRTAKLKTKYGVILLPREYRALIADYERAYGIHPYAPRQHEE